MSFRYADGAPFPLDSNFLATTTRLVKVCAALVANDLVDAGWDAGGDGRAPVLSLLEDALPLADLPETRVSIRFAAGARPGTGSIVAAERTYFGLALEAAVDVDADTVFHGPFRVREVATSVHASLPERRWFGRSPKHRSLDRHFVVGAFASDSAASITLARRPGRGQIRADLRDRRFNLDDGSWLPIAADDLRALTGLWQRVARGMYNRAGRVRRRVVSGNLGAEPLERIGNARRLVERLIGAVAPLFAEVLYRGGRSDALVLYENDTLYVVPLRELHRIVERLDPAARDVFVPLGLAAPRPDSGVRPLPLAAVPSAC